MKKILMTVIVIVIALATPLTAYAVKPDNNNAGAMKVNWYLPGVVIGLPYGGYDIVGSDTASTLIVNQPNGATEVVITGVMRGLTPNTSYTVLLSSACTPQCGNYPGYFNPAIRPTVFETDAFGAGSWHMNLVNADFPSVGEYDLSIWINITLVDGSLLFSGNFSVIVE